MGIFNKIKKTNEMIKEEATKEVKQIIPKPKICCIDLTEDVTNSLSETGYIVFPGTLGAIREIPNKRSGDYKLLLLDYKYPDNFHEFDALIIDLTNEIRKEFEPLTIEERKSKNNSLLYLACSYPATLFDSRPLSSSILFKKIGEVHNRKFIQIVFASKKYEVDYEIIEISGYDTNRRQSEKHFLYEFNYSIPVSEPRTGKEVSICSVQEDMYNFLKKHTDDLTYEQTFAHPTEWDAGKNKYIPSPKLIPLLKNINDEIVSFFQVNGNNITFVFPNIKNKNEFVLELFKNILPSIFPEVFPFSTQFKWTENSEYFAPNHQKLLEEKLQLSEEYERNKFAIENKISENSKKYKFLHDIITETDDKLVYAVFTFLKFLEFKNVILKDEESNSIKEEDIQV
ncbi:MAG: hypothetical protein ABR968_13420, partial [Bacteroidales bacterium]